MTTSIASLDRYRLLGRSGLRVSPLCLGAMTFGTAWGGMGVDKAESKRVFDRYVDKGGNFIDTANKYHEGESESYLGEFMAPIRDRIVLATKYSLSSAPGTNDPNAFGNHRKNMVQAVEKSLKRLQTSYIDLYWVHIWDFTTPTDEVMRALDDLVRAGKVLHVGISDAPAWKVAQANTLASLRGWSPFVALQIEWSLVERTVERELVPMARELDLAVTPWSPLGGGLLTGKHSAGAIAKDSGRGDWLGDRFTPRNVAIIEELKKVAADVGRTPAEVALQWLVRKPGTVIPIIGAKTLLQLDQNLGCLDFALDAAQIARLDKVSAIELGFPHDFAKSEQVHEIVTGGARVELPSGGLA